MIRLDGPFLNLDSRNGSRPSPTVVNAHCSCSRFIARHQDQGRVFSSCYVKDSFEYGTCCLIALKVDSVGQQISAGVERNPLLL